MSFANRPEKGTAEDLNAETEKMVYPLMSKRDEKMAASLKEARTECKNDREKRP